MLKWNAVSVVLTLLWPIALVGDPAHECAALKAFPFLDRENTFTSNLHLVRIQTFFRQEQFNTYQEAVQAAKNIGLNIEDVLGFRFGGYDAQSQFTQWQSALLSTSSSAMSDSEILQHSVEKVSVAMADVLKTVCLPRDGLSAHVEPYKDHRHFSLEVRFVPPGSVSIATGKITISPQSVSDSCEPQELVGKPLSITGAGLAITCYRRPQDSVQFVINTTEGHEAFELPGYSPPPPGIMHFDANPSRIKKGGSTVLSWSTRDAVRLELEGVGDVSAPNGSQRVSPQSTTQYRLFATGEDGTRIYAWNWVAVDEPSPPPPAQPGLSFAQMFFHTNDDDKDADTHVSTRVDCPGGTVASAASDYRRFPENSDAGWYDLTVTRAVPITELTNCGFHIRIDPNGNDTWKFNVSLHLGFENGQNGDVRDFSWTGIVLSQDNRDAEWRLQ